MPEIHLLHGPLFERAMSTSRRKRRRRRSTCARLRTLMPNSLAAPSAVWNAADRLTQTSVEAGAMRFAVTEVAVIA
jgi:hypothetical protein